MNFTPPSSNFYILHEADHAERAQALAPGKCQDVGLPAKTVPGMDTLTFWGHGTPDFLCGKKPKEVAGIVKNWRASNKKIETVEILTCNSRHAPGGNDPFVAKLRSELGFLLRGLKIKSMPIRMGPGGMNGDSILFADFRSKTWCYVTAPRELALQAMRSLFKEICEKSFGDDAVETATYLTTPPGRMPQEGPLVNPFAKWAREVRDVHENGTIQGFMAAGDKRPEFMKDLVKALKNDAFRREFIASRKYTMNYGTFEKLRDQLVKIK